MPDVLGVSDLAIASGRSGALNFANAGLPCQSTGKGMAWLCSMTWIVATIGTGHACAVPLSVWGGPLRLQAAQQGEKPNHVLSRIVHHPIDWIRELEEWKYVSSIANVFYHRGGKQKRIRRDNIFNPDPLLFPATWMPLRWLQIFAIAKAFSTDPSGYRWCLPEETSSVNRLMKQYLVQKALYDEWNRVFLGEKRVGLGILVVTSYFVALLLMFCTTFTLDGGATAMLVPSVLAALLSGLMNIAIFVDVQRST